MKKRLKLFIMAAVLASLCPGCGTAKDSQNTASAQAESEDQTEKNEEETVSETPKVLTPTVMETPEVDQEVTPEPTQEATPAPEEVLEDTTAQQVAEKINSMSTEEKVAQLFIITVEDAAGTERTPGGIIYFSNNLGSREDICQRTAQDMASSLAATGLPLFTAIDEEGGRVANLAKHDGLGIENVGSAQEIAADGDFAHAYDSYATIGAYMSELGFNLDFAPVADVRLETSSNDVGDRSFGTDADVVAGMLTQAVDGLHSAGVLTTIKHFPGNGMSVVNTHSGISVTEKTQEDMAACEWIPFQEGITAGTDFVMVGHVSAPNVTGDDTPASLSSVMIQDILRNQLGFQGIIITDALNMGAIVNTYGSAESAVKAFTAGADMLLMPNDYQAAYAAVLNAVSDGSISEERLNESLTRIFTTKIKMYS